MAMGLVADKTEAERRHRSPAATEHGQRHRCRQGVKRVQESLPSPWIGNPLQHGKNRNHAGESPSTDRIGNFSEFQKYFNILI